MSVQANRATQLLDNPLLWELMDEYQAVLYERWLAVGDIESQQAERAKARGVRDMRTWITGKCSGIIDDG